MFACCFGTPLLEQLVDQRFPACGEVGEGAPILAGQQRPRGQADRVVVKFYDKLIPGTESE